MAASSTAQPPGVVKTLTDDKKRKRPVKKRRGKKLTVAESESEAESEAQAQAQAEAEAEAEAEAARSSKRREATIRAVVKGDPTVTTIELAKAKIRTVQDHGISMEQLGAAFAAFAPTGARDILRCPPSPRE
eukprot:jgi/Tetstr1/460900/TSEL_006056.t1